MKYVSLFKTFNTLINVLMGTDALVLPPAVANACFSSSLIALFFMLFIGVICAEYMIEVINEKYSLKCLAAVNAIDSQRESDINVEHRVRLNLVIIKLREIWFQIALLIWITRKKIVGKNK